MCDIASPVVDAGLENLLSEPGLGVYQQDFQDGDVLFEVGQEALLLFRIIRGQVRLFQRGVEGSERLIDIFGAGQWVGSEALAGRRNHRCRAVAVGDTTLTVAPVATLLAQLPRYPQVAVQLLQQVAEKLQLAREDAGRLVFDDCNRRLVKTLLRFSASAAATRVPEGVVLHITHQQLAQAVGVARETVSLALTHLRQQNLLRTGRNRLTFDPHALERLADDKARAGGADVVAAIEPGA